MDKRIGTFENQKLYLNKILTKALYSKISKEEFDKLASRMKYNLVGRKQYFLNDLSNKCLSLLTNDLEDSNAWETIEQSKAMIRYR